MHLVNANRRAHGRLDEERLHVLPVLLQEGDEEVDRQHGVGDELVLSHADVAGSDTKAKNLLKLELDGRLDLGDLVLKVVGVRDRSGELAGLGETGAEETRDLLDECLGGQEGVVLLGELLDELLVLVEFLQIVSGHVLEVNLLCAIDVSSIGENAERETRARNVRELDGTRETLITLRVVVLEANLKLDGLYEVTTLLAVVGFVEHVLDGASHA